MDQELENNETFSISNIINNEIEQRESFIEDSSRIVELLFKQYNNQQQNDENKLISESLSMVFDLFKEMVSPLYTLVNDDMMPNIFELYQMTEDLRYHFAIFNGDIKNKLKNITTNKVEICNDVKELIKKIVTTQYDIDRKPIDEELISNLRKEENDKNNEKQQDEKEQKNDLEEKEIKDCFFLLFQLFTSIVYNLQSNCEKLLLQSIDISKNNFKRQFYNHLIKRDLNYIENLISRLNLINEKEENSTKENSFDSFSKLFLENIINNNNNYNNNNINNNNLLESFQNIFSNYIEKNNLNVELILESFNNNN
ncbi:hypothetical protein RB653_004066 [Dictyostelium firmibasis]|uniref:Uncharacterized protein n=1 Tax=Dictyostelium firmibasis TaxID=79012 RepID=A0AAN7YWP6_9MYCE